MTSHRTWWLALTVVVMITGARVGLSQTDTPLTTQALQIDFTLPLAALMEGAARATGISFDETQDHFAILHNRNQLAVVSSQGEPIRNAAFTTEQDLFFQGVTVNAEGLSYGVTQQGEVYQLDSDPSHIIQFQPTGSATLDIASIAFDPQLKQLYAISRVGKKYLYQLMLNGNTTTIELDDRLAAYDILGADFHGDYLYTLSHRNSDESRFAIIESTRRGAILRAWSFEAPAPLNPAGVAVINPDRGEFAVAHDNDEATVTLLEDPAAIEGPPAEGIPLNLVQLFELGHRQPSGVAYDDSLSALYYVTDFGEVLHSDLACHGTTKLFELDDVLQGDMEAIDVGENGTLTVLKSDILAGPPSLQSYGLDGQLRWELPIPLDSPDHLFSGLAYDDANRVYYLVSGREDEATAAAAILYRIDLQGRVQTFPLPPELAAYTTVGLDIDPTGTRLWLVMSERYVALLKLDTMDVLSIRTINQTPTPSGIAVSEKMIYITSDVDQSLVYGFRLPN